MFKRISFSSAATAALVVCAVVLTGNTAALSYRNSHKPPTEPWTTVNRWQNYAAEGHATGAATPRVTVVVFSDYQCPVCLHTDRELRVLGKKHPSDLRIVWRHFPLVSHPYARPAAIASECAGLQNRFAEFHEDLFDHQSVLGKVEWTTLALNSGLDTGSFAQCFRDSSVVKIVDRDLSAGIALGVGGTPTILINDEEYQGLPWDFQSIVERHLGPQARGQAQ